MRPSPRRWLCRRRLFSRFRSERPGQASELGFLFWCAALDHDPRGAFDREPRWRGETWLGLSDPGAQEANPRMPGWTPLHEACYLGSPAAVAALCLSRPEWVNARDSRGVSPLRAMFLFNGASPAWKHPGPFGDGAHPRPLASDADIAHCVQSMLGAGAKLRGGEVCAAAFLGLTACCEILSTLPHAHADCPDEFSSRTIAPSHVFLHAPANCSLAVYCALEGSDPRSALPIALSAPPAMDQAHATLLCNASRFSCALAFLDARPSCAQAILEALCDAPSSPNSPRDREDAAALARLALSLGADPSERSVDLEARMLASPIDMAARHARPELLRAILDAAPPVGADLDALAARCAASPTAEAQPRQACLALFERSMLAEQSPAAQHPRPQASQRL